MKKPGKAALTKARALYDEGAMPLAAIAKQIGLTESAFRALRKREAWPMRGAQSAEAELPDAPLTDDENDIVALERRLVRALRREIARAEKGEGNDPHPGAERKARILGLLVKTLGDLRKLSERPQQKDASHGDETGDGVDDPPRDLATLRDALVARLERLRDARGDA